VIHKAIKYILENDATFAAAIGTDSSDSKVFPVLVPQTVVLPFCTYELSNTEPHPNKDSISDMDFDRVRVTVYADDHDEAMTLAGYCRAALDKVTPATYNTIAVDSIDFLSWQDGYSQQMGAEPVFYFMLEFDCAHRVSY